MNLFIGSPGEVATLASTLEVCAPKPGNVHRGADFDDVGLNDFLISGLLLGQTIDGMEDKAPGETIKQAVKLTQHVVGSNTNLGIILLIVPLAKAAKEHLSQEALAKVLSNLNRHDMIDTLDAIAMASPGGLGESDAMDVNDDEYSVGVGLIDAMKHAQDRDRIARQYATNFGDVFEVVLPQLIESRKRFGDLNRAIVHTHVALMSRWPDSLIGRKCGEEVAQQSAAMAGKALDQLQQGDEQFWSAVSELDFWLRSDGHRRNPGTTADLIAAGLFVGIRTGQLGFPFK